VDLVGSLGTLLEGVVAERAGFSFLGAAILLWISTRLVACLRVTLRRVFEEEQGRGVVRGKLFDLKVVAWAGLLLVVNMGVSIGARALEARGVVVLGLGGESAARVQGVTSLLLSMISAWVLFFLIYWYLPARRIPFRTAAVGASFTATAFELMKSGFAWYVASVADYSNVYGSLGVVAILFFWIYYSSVVFILGGQVARVYEVRRELRMARRDVDGISNPAGARGAGGAALGAALLLLVPLAGAAQPLSPFGGNGKATGFLNAGEGVVFAVASLDRNLSLSRPLVEHDGPYIVVHLAENRVFVLEGTEVVWSAPAGTGHGFQLEGQGREWTFTTPIGMFHVLRKEKDPVWIAPDWYYVQRSLAIPAPQNRARIPGTLGTSALFLGDGIAIHGTDNPGLLLQPDPEDRRVSHGCIRLTNEAARELFHRVDVGTPVLIF
jgi:YihY family inner membrane protein